MELLPLSLSVKTSVWRMDDPQGSIVADKAFERMRLAVLSRDRSICQFCGFGVPERANAGRSGFMEVHHRDDNHENNSEKNLVTACPFCHAVFHFGLSHAQGRGFFILSRGVSQRSLNRMMVLHWYIPFSTHPFLKDISKELSVWIDKGRDDMREYFGKYADGTSLANELMKVVSANNEKRQREIGRVLSHLLLVPKLDHEHYKKATSMWSEDLRVLWGQRKVVEFVNEAMEEIRAEIK